MINEALYVKHINSITDNPESSIRIVRDIEEVKVFEQHSGKIVGVIDNLPYYNINLDVYADVSGRLFRYSNIEYSKMGAAVLPIFRIDGTELFLLEWHYRQFTNRMHWEIPRGFADLNDISTKITALRELAEETNIIQNELTMNIIELGTLFPDTGLCNAEISLFAAEVELTAQHKLRNNDETEAIGGYRMFSMDDLQELITRNEITDSFTLAAIFRYQIKKL